MSAADQPARRSPYLLGCTVIPPRIQTRNASRPAAGAPSPTAPSNSQPPRVAQALEAQPAAAAPTAPRGEAARQDETAHAFADQLAAMSRQRRRLANTAWLIAVIAAFITGVLTGIVAIERGMLTTARAPERAAVKPAPIVNHGDIASVANAVLQSTVFIAADAAEGTSTGSGWVYADDGTIVTNAHVITEKGELLSDIVVIDSDGKQYDASVVGYTRDYDLAVLKISGANLPVLPLGEAQNLQVGDQVVAVGAPLGLQGTVTTGIISALNRPVESGGDGQASFLNAIQTDAAINPGNSGGPLVDLAGNVVGVNSAVAQPVGAQRSTIGSIGLGFAIPAEQVRRTVEEIIEKGYATFPAIGVMVDTRERGAGAVIVADDADSVIAGGPAAAAGLQPGDRIVAVNDVTIRDVTHFIVYMRALTPGDEARLQVVRDDKRFSVQVRLEEKRAD